MTTWKALIDQALDYMKNLIQARQPERNVRNSDKGLPKVSSPGDNIEWQIEPSHMQLGNYGTVHQIECEHATHKKVSIKIYFKNAMDINLGMSWGAAQLDLVLNEYLIYLIY